MKPPPLERTVLAGPAGPLEAVVSEPADGESTTRSFAVVCHPHPLYGGTLDNKVIHTLARAFAACGAATIRFNFRGVGTSAGTFDEGRGETEDALAVIAYGQARWRGAALWLAGFSFGGAVAVHAAARSAPARMVLVAPGITRVTMQDVPSPPCPWLLIQGDADEVIDSAQVLRWAARQSVAPTLRRFSDTGHFFHGRLHELRAAVTQFICPANAGAAG